MRQKFLSEHIHTEDEVRFFVRGSGDFVMHVDGRVYDAHCVQGDLISVPLGTRHWFDLCDDRRIRAIRLFQDMSGWTPHYVEGGVHAAYEPLCLGPAWVSGSGKDAT
jgi:1,2-dihydroxy-3-keto-5-methylthiopentene dioxygenase